MAIMVAGGLTFAIPGADPVFAEVSTSNPHLYVSAEGQDPDNAFAEGNIIEVIIRDDTIGDTDEGEAEPEVTINGADLRMLQTANGYWTAYFAEEDALAGIEDEGSLDYGVYCSETAASSVTGLELSDGNGIYLPPGSDCSDSSVGTGGHPLIREHRDLTNYDDNSLGQLGLSGDNLWPFIQVYDFTSLADVDIVYNRGGTQESVTLTFDDPSESHTLDRQKYPRSAHVHIALMDYALNIDPTDEDTWVFDTQNGAAYYNVFDEDGNPLNAMNPVSVGSEAGIDETVSIVRGAQGEDVIDCQVTKDFGIQEEDDASRDYLVVDDDGACVPNVLGAGASAVFASGNFAIGFVEDGSNNNVFINWAEDQRSNIVVKDDAPRGNSFEVDYSSPDAKSGLVGHFFAELSLDVSDGVWNSGERIPVVLTDMDANVNPLAEDDLTVANPNSLLVPSIRIGSPVTLESATGDVVWFDIPPPPERDTTDPVITVTGVDVTLPEGASYVDQGATCTDARDGNLAVTLSGSVDVNTVGAYTLTYTCTDSAGNGATATRTVTVTDGTPPTITLNGPSPATVNVGDTYTDAGASCTDPVDGILTVNDDVATAVDTSSRGSYTVTYTCTDNSGNEATATRTVVVTDSDSPTIVIRGPASIEVPQGSTYVDQGAECADNADPNPRLSTNNPVNTGSLGTYSVTYTCQDSDGNLVTANRVVTVATPDTTAPTLTLNGQPAVSVLQGASYPDPGASCTDDRDANPTVTVTPATVDTNTVGTTTQVYSCVDASGNTAPTVSRTVTVTAPDTVPPRIAVNPATVSVVQDRAYTAETALSGVTCTDTNDQNPILTANVSGVDTSTLGTYTVTYACMDASGNTAAASRTVTVVEADRDAPTITLNGPSIIELVEGQTYTERGALCTDVADGNLAVTIGGDTVDTTRAGSYTVTYGCVDSSNNAASTQRTVNVAADLTLFTVTQGGWDDGRLILNITGKTALAGVMLDSSTAIAGFPVRVAAEFGSGDIDQTVTVTDISVHGDTEFYLTADNGVRSNSETVNIPNALDLTGVAIATDENGATTYWANGQIKLNVTGTIGVSSASLVTSDGTLVAAEVPITNASTGSIDSTTTASLITLDNISLAGKNVTFALKNGDVTSPAADETEIPAILRLDTITYPNDGWNDGALSLTLEGGENVTNSNANPANPVNLVVKTADGYVQVRDNTGVGLSGADNEFSVATTAATVTLNDIRISGSTEFRLNFTDASGNNTMSNPQTLDIPKILDLVSVKRPDTAATFADWQWTATGLVLNVTGVANLTATNDNPITLTINGEETTTTVNGIVEGGLEVRLLDSTLQNTPVRFGVTYTDTEERTITDELSSSLTLAPTDLNLVSVTPGVWNHTTGVLPLTIEGNVGNILESGVELVVSGAAAGLTVTNGTGGVITAVADLPATDIGVSGMTNFTLRTGSTATTDTVSNTVQADVPPVFAVESVKIDSGWSRTSTGTFATLPLTVTGYENATGAVSINAYVPNDTTPIRDLSPTANTDYADTDVDGTLDDDGTIDTGVTLGTGFTEFSNQEIEIHLSTTDDSTGTQSNNFTMTVPYALLLDDLKVDRTSLGKMRLMVEGSSFLIADYDSVVLAMYANMNADDTLIPTQIATIKTGTSDRNADGSSPISGTIVLDSAEDAAVSGMTVYVRLEAADADVSTARTIVSEMYRVTLPAAGSSSNVDMIPTPASFSHSIGFPPITRAVINDIGAIPAIHNVQAASQDPVAVYTWINDDDKDTKPNMEVEAFSDRLRLSEPSDRNAITGHSKIVIYGWEPPTFAANVTTLFNWNFGGINYDGIAPDAVITDIRLANANHSQWVSLGSGASGLADITAMKDSIGALGDTVDLVIMLSNTDLDHVCGDLVLVADFFTFGQNDEDGRVNNAIYRIEVEEASSNSDLFEGTVEYTMLNQLNIDDPKTYTGLRPISDQISMIVHEDFTDEDSVRVNYLDLGADGVSTQIAIQQAAPTHSAVVSFDSESYKIADTVTITLEDADLNVDNDVIDIYTFSSELTDYIGDDKAYILDVTFDDELWTSGACGTGGFASTGFTLQETASGSGVFTGDFQIPEEYCQSSTGNMVSVTGVDIEVNYQDFRDASGEEIEVGAGAAVRANTGTVSLDRTVYPVPFAADVFEHTSGYLGQHDLTVHVTIDDPDFDISAAGEDVIGNATEYLTVQVIRGSASHPIDLNDAQILETAPDSGAFELDLPLTYSDGPDGEILQGDILQVEYEDPTDASGEPNTVTDSATFDLRNGVLQSDKSVYIIGSDMILTLIEPDLDLENDGAESYTLDLIEWDSDAGTLGMNNAVFDPEPSELRETGDSTGIFQVIVEIPAEIDGDRLERGEEIELEYVDHGPSGADYVGDESEDVGLTVFTSNFGATIELDQKVYTWTDKVYITIVAPDHNFDSALVDEIGDSDLDPIQVSTRSADIDNYKLVETGPDTGIFTGEVILIGFDHNADGDTETGTDTAGYDNPQRDTSPDGSGPTNGYLQTDDDDGITVSFEYSDDETIVGSALIRWNIGEVQWLESSYPASGTGVVRVIDPDMNWNPEAVNNFVIDVWSDADNGGIDLTVTETNEATGIFEGTVFFTITDESSGHRLRVAEGNTVTAEYEDNTLPDPYTTADELDITATTLIGTIVPPLERAPATNLRIVDAFGNSLDTVSADQQVQIVADLANGQDRSQAFAYLVQVQDASGVTVALSWISGTLEAGQSLSPSTSWIPSEAGTYTATAFVWESVDNPTALSPPVTTDITVS